MYYSKNVNFTNYSENTQNVSKEYSDVEYKEVENETSDKNIFIALSFVACALVVVVIALGTMVVNLNNKISEVMDTAQEVIPETSNLEMDEQITVNDSFDEEYETTLNSVEGAVCVEYIIPAKETEIIAMNSNENSCPWINYKNKQLIMSLLDTADKRYMKR